MTYSVQVLGNSLRWCDGAVASARSSGKDDAPSIHAEYPRKCQSTAKVIDSTPTNERGRDFHLVSWYHLQRFYIQQKRAPIGASVWNFPSHPGRRGRFRVQLHYFVQTENTIRKGHHSTEQGAVSSMVMLVG
jgi:hypothetical protein